MRDRLQSFGRVRGLVFGQYGEWSEDVDSLLEVAATAAARRDWRMRGNRTMEEARGIYIALYRIAGWDASWCASLRATASGGSRLSA